MNHFGDPGYKYHAAMSQLWGVTAMRLAQADVLPLDFEFYGDTINQFLAELEKNKQLRARETRTSPRRTKPRKELASAAAQTAALLNLTPSRREASMPAQLASINQSADAGRSQLHPA